MQPLFKTTEAGVDVWYLFTPFQKKRITDATEVSRYNAYSGTQPTTSTTGVQITWWDGIVAANLAAIAAAVGTGGLADSEVVDEFEMSALVTNLYNQLTAYIDTKIP